MKWLTEWAQSQRHSLCACDMHTSEKSRIRSFPWHNAYWKLIFSRAPAASYSGTGSISRYCFPHSEFCQKSKMIGVRFQKSTKRKARLGGVTRTQMNLINLLRIIINASEWVTSLCRHQNGCNGSYTRRNIHDLTEQGTTQRRICNSAILANIEYVWKTCVFIHHEFNNYKVS